MQCITIIGKADIERTVEGHQRQQMALGTGRRELDALDQFFLQAAQFLQQRLVVLRALRCRRRLLMRSGLGVGATTRYRMQRRAVLKCKGRESRKSHGKGSQPAKSLPSGACRSLIPLRLQLASKVARRVWAHFPLPSP